MHLLDLNQWATSDIERIFDLAGRLKRGEMGPVLAGKTFVLFFPETSLRTRVTFEKGIMDLGGSSLLFPPETLDRRESLRDTVGYLENEADGLIVRHAEFAKIEEMAGYAAIPVINAMTSWNHPCEILADLFSIRERRADYRELVYTFVGPAGNIARTWASAASVLNLDFRHVCVPGQEITGPSANYTYHTELDGILRSSDVLLTDSLPAPFRTEDYFQRYQITLDRMKRAKKAAMLNPCPPFFRGEEVSEEAIASDYFVGYGFKKNLLYVQQAILLACLGVEQKNGNP